MKDPEKEHRWIEDDWTDPDGFQQHSSTYCAACYADWDEEESERECPGAAP